MPPKKKRLTPEELLVQIQGEEAAKTYEFEDYLPVIHVLYTEKGHSYSDIAKFVEERLGITASRGQVYRAYQMWLAKKNETDADRASAEAYDESRPEYEVRVDEEANKLLDFLSDEFAGRGNAPWDDHEIIVARAAEILVARQQAADAAEVEAGEADEKRDFEKRRPDAH
jgi:hypothetical protein